MAAVVKVLALLLAATGINAILHDREFVTTLNTFLNLVSVAILVRAQRKIRKDIAPQVGRVEDAVSAVVNAQEGGRRDYDPPHTPHAPPHAS